MPFNGDVTFHDLKITIPTSYIRDSTQSDQDLWIFEQDGYEQVILLSRVDQQGDADQLLDEYVTLMQERQASAQRTTFLDQGAVHSTYTQDGTYCQEMLFLYNGSCYAIALRGGTENDFSELLNSAGLVQPSAQM